MAKGQVSKLISDHKEKQQPSRPSPPPNKGSVDDSTSHKGAGVDTLFRDKLNFQKPLIQR